MRISNIIRLVVLLLLPSLAAAQPTLADTSRFHVFDRSKHWIATGLELKTYVGGGGGSGDITNGGNTTGADITIGTNDAFGLNFETNGVTRFNLTGGASTGGLITNTATSANTATVADVLTLGVNSTGTAAASFGGGILWKAESSTTNDQEVARQSAYWTTATHASREGGIAWQLGNGGGALATTMYLDRVNDSDGRLHIGASTPVVIDNDQITYDNDFSLSASSSASLTITSTEGILDLYGSAVATSSSAPSTRLQIHANRSGTTANGFGPRILLLGESSTTNSQEMVGLRAAWTDVTDATREASFGVQLGDAGGALTDVFTINRSSDADGALIVGTGNSLQIDNDEITAGLPFTISGGTNALTLGGGSGNVVIGGTAGSGSISRYSSTGNITDIRETSATTTTIGTGIIARSTGTPAAGFGPKLTFFSESTTTLDQDAGVIETPWTTATHATRTSDMVFSTVNSGTTAEAFRIYGNKRAMVGGGTNQASAAFQVTSTTGGFLPPKVTTTEMNAISSPVEGLRVHNTTEKGEYTYNGSAWARSSMDAVTGRATGQTAAVASVATLTVGSTDATYLISGNILITTSGSESFSLQVDYTDEGNTARTITIPIMRIATAAFTNATISVSGAVPYPSATLQIRCKASTSITIKTSGTFTGCTYNVEGSITRIQ